MSRRCKLFLFHNDILKSDGLSKKEMIQFLDSLPNDAKIVNFDTCRSRNSSMFLIESKEFETVTEFMSIPEERYFKNEPNPVVFSSINDVFGYYLDQPSLMTKILNKEKESEYMQALKLVNKVKKAELEKKRKELFIQGEGYNTAYIEKSGLYHYVYSDITRTLYVDKDLNKLRNARYEFQGLFSIRCPNNTFLRYNEIKGVVEIHDSIPLNDPEFRIQPGTYPTTHSFSDTPITFSGSVLDFYTIDNLRHDKERNEALKRFLGSFNKESEEKWEQSYLDVNKQVTKSCECGAEKVKSNMHSGWCPKHE